MALRAVSKAATEEATKEMTLTLIPTPTPKPHLTINIITRELKYIE